MHSMLRAAALTTALVALAACGSGSGGRNIGELLAGPAGPLDENEYVGERPEPAFGQPVCPPVVVRDGTATMRVYEGGAEGDGSRLRYQGGIDRTARECTFEGETAVTMEIGVTGRLVLGRSGAPGSYTLPVRMAVVRPGGEPAWTELFNVPITVPAGEGGARFSHVETVRIELPAGEPTDRYVAYVGFDEIGR